VRAITLMKILSFCGYRKRPFLPQKSPNKKRVGQLSSTLFRKIVWGANKIWLVFQFLRWQRQRKRVRRGCMVLYQQESEQWLGVQERK